MVNLLVDTSIFIDHFRQIDKSHTHLSILPHPFRRYTASIVVFELERGLSMSQTSRKKIVRALISTYTVIPLTVSIAQLAGELDRKQQITANDAIIAATCLEHDLTLVTLNAKHFRAVPRLKLFT